jgi:hypothetical protein
MLLAIIVNSAMLGLADYSKYDAKTGKVGTEGSWQNQLIASTEVYFLCVFTLECLLKIYAMGLCRGKGTYLGDYWNWLDFVVVLSGWVQIAFDALGLAASNISFLRMFKFLRPLRTLTGLGLQNVVSCLFLSIPPLGNVIALLFFLFFVFGSAGVLIWGSTGALHGRCRLLPFPIKLPAVAANDTMAEDKLSRLLWVAGAGVSREGLSAKGGSTDERALLSELLKPYIEIGPSEMTSTSKLFGVLLAAHTNLRCIPAANEDMGITVDVESPWYPRHRCWWPIDRSVEGLCSLQKPFDNPACAIGGTNGYCGSNYDRFGNARFEHAEVMLGDLYTEGTDWG